MVQSSAAAVVAFSAGLALGAGACLYLTTQDAKKRKAATDGGDGREFRSQLPDSEALAADEDDGEEEDSGDPSSSPPSSLHVREFEQDEVLHEHLKRNIQFFGLEGQRRLADAFVVVVGLGVSQ
jgi:hypothetical protein